MLRLRELQTNESNNLFHDCFHQAKFFQSYKLEKVKPRVKRYEETWKSGNKIEKEVVFQVSDRNML